MRLESIEFSESNEGPEGYRHVVTANGRIIAWLTTESLAEHVAWTLSFQDMLAESMNRQFLATLSEYLDKLVEKTDLHTVPKEARLIQY